MRNCKRRWFGVIGFVLVWFCCGSHASDGASSPAWKDRYDNYTDWAIYRGDKKANQYSSLTQINATNVHKLKLAWEYHHGDPDGPSMYSNPIVIDGLLYFTTPRINAVALDAATGKERWIFAPVLSCIYSIGRHLCPPHEPGAARRAALPRRPI